MAPAAVRNYVIAAKSANSLLEGVLYVGNVKLPSFYKIRPDVTETAVYPVYFEDLDATFSRLQAPGTIDPTCDESNEPLCVVGDPTTVPEHDLDTITPGPSAATELWASFLPVGVVDSANSYADFASQLRPYLNKVIAYYAGQFSPNGRYYFVSNDPGERLDWTWEAFGGQNMDSYGHPGPNGKISDACLAKGQNLCYTRWATESFCNSNDFLAHY